MATVINKSSLLVKEMVNPNNYNDGEWIIDPDFSKVKDIPKGHWKIVGDQVIPKSKKERDLFDKETLDSHYRSAVTRKLREIDNEVRNRISEGFKFDKNIFSLSANAQLNWNMIKSLTKDDFPYEISTKDNKTYILKWNDISKFINVMTTTMSKHLSFGRKLKERVFKYKKYTEINDIKVANN